MVPEAINSKLADTKRPPARRSGRKNLILRPSWRGALTEPSTWAGIAAIAGALMTGGLAGVADPAILGQIATGVGLIALREVKEAD